LLRQANVTGEVGVIALAAAALPAGHPGTPAAATPEAAAHVCTRGTCGLPVATPEALREALARLHAA
jgi:hypothetical protein